MGLEDDVRQKLNSVRIVAGDLNRGEALNQSKLSAALLDLQEQLAMVAQAVEDLQETS